VSGFIWVLFLIAVQTIAVVVFHEYIVFRTIFLSKKRYISMISHLAMLQL